MHGIAWEDLLAKGVTQSRPQKDRQILYNLTPMRLLEVKFTETDTRMLVARDWREERLVSA